MIEVRVELVYRRVLDRVELSTREAELIWRTVVFDGVPVLRALIDRDTGEILDDVVVWEIV